MAFDLGWRGTIGRAVVAEGVEHADAHRASLASITALMYGVLGPAAPQGRQRLRRSAGR
jgi:hypothetical protein